MKHDTARIRDVRAVEVSALAKRLVADGWDKIVSALEANEDGSSVKFSMAFKLSGSLVEPVITSSMSVSHPVKIEQEPIQGRNPDQLEMPLEAKG